MAHIKHSSKRKDHSYTGLSQKKNSQINNLIVHLKELREEEKTNPKHSRRKDGIKTRMEINDRFKNNRKDQ